MKSLYDFIVEPAENRYQNTKKVGDKELVLNTEVFNHQYVSREAVVISIPTALDTDILPGDIIIVHHNVFRRWHNVKGIEKNSRSYMGDNRYALREDQIFLYKRDGKWNGLEGYCFVKPLAEDDMFATEKEKALIGVIKHGGENAGPSISNGDLIGFRPNSEYEFILDGERLYRVFTDFITIKYEYKGNEEEYNPSWAHSS